MDFTKTQGGLFIKGSAAAHRHEGLHLGPDVRMEDFEAKVLELLLRNGVTSFGVPPVGFKAGLDGWCKVMFEGIDPQGHARKFSLRFVIHDVEENGVKADAIVLADLIAHLTAEG